MSKIMKNVEITEELYELLSEDAENLKMSKTEVVDYALREFYHLRYESMGNIAIHSPLYMEVLMRANINNTTETAIVEDALCEMFFHNDKAA